jgi:hypothetical protein
MASSDALSKADAAFASKSYQEAIELYTKASATL